MKIQPRIKQKRLPANTRTIKEINYMIEHTARKFDVSKSWVIAVALSEAFGIEIESYIPEQKKLRRVK